MSMILRWVPFVSNLILFYSFKFAQFVDHFKSFTVPKFVCLFVLFIEGLQPAQPTNLKING